MNNRMQTRGIRGATTAEENTPEAILSATRELLLTIVEDNALATGAIAAVFFSATPDLNSAFPARAARELGWVNVPLFCMTEIDVPEALNKCLRVMMLVNTSLEQEEIKHVYLKETISLRQQ